MGPYARLWIASLASALASLTATTADAQAARPAANAVQRREDHGDGDRWKRAEEKARAAARSEDGGAVKHGRKKEVITEADADVEVAKGVQARELNGKLSLGEWQ